MKRQIAFLSRRVHVRLRGVLGRWCSSARCSAGLPRRGGPAGCRPALAAAGPAAEPCGGRLRDGAAAARAWAGRGEERTAAGLCALPWACLRRRQEVGRCAESAAPAAAAGRGHCRLAAPAASEPRRRRRFRAVNLSFQAWFSLLVTFHRLCRRRHGVKGRGRVSFVGTRSISSGERGARARRLPRVGRGVTHGLVLVMRKTVRDSASHTGQPPRDEVGAHSL